VSIRTRALEFKPIISNRGGARLVPDSKFPALMWRVRWPDGELSDMVNLSRAKDALASFLESVDRRQRRRQSSPGGRRFVQTMGAVS
jgi:hypothetical protein